MSGTDRLQDFRLRRGITQEQVAEALVQLAAADGLEVKVDGSVISKWERGKKRPRRHYRRLLCRFYQTTEEDLGLNVRAMTDPSVLAQNQPNLVERDFFSLTTPEAIATLQQLTASDVTCRRDALMAMAAASGALLLRPIREWVGSMLPIADDAQPRQIGFGLDEVAHFEEMVGVFCKWVSQTGSHMRKAAIGQVQAIGDLIDETSPGPVKTRLLEVAAQMTQLAGCMSYDCRMYGVAQRYYLLGLRFCQEAGNHLIPSKLIGELSYIATAMGNHQESLELIDFALYSLPIQQQGLVRAELLARRASALALLGKSSDARRSIEASLEMSANAENEPLPPVFDYLSSGEIHGLAATTYLDVARHTERNDSISGYAAKAEQEILAALDGREKSLARSRAVDTIRLMSTRLLQNEPSEAVKLGNTVLELARGVRSSRVADRLVQFQRELQDRHPRFPTNAEFHDRLRAHLIHTGENGVSFFA